MFSSLAVGISPQRRRIILEIERVLRMQRPQYERLVRWGLGYGDPVFVPAYHAESVGNFLHPPRGKRNLKVFGSLEKRMVAEARSINNGRKYGKRAGGARRPGGQWTTAIRGHKNDTIKSCLMNARAPAHMRRVTRPRQLFQDDDEYGCCHAPLDDDAAPEP